MRLTTALGSLLFLAAACSTEATPERDAAARPDAPPDAEDPVDASLVDTAVADAAEAGAPSIPRWLLTVENSGVDNEVHRLLRVGVATSDYGMTREICANITLPTTVPASNIISSLTFNQGRLLASGRGVENGDTMFEIDPCTCTATVVGPYGYSSVPGITSIGVDMFGITTAADLVIGINPMTAMGTSLGMLPGDWGTAGLSWSGPMRNSLLGISGADDTLVEFNPATGAVVGRPTTLDYDFGSVGMEYHPGMRTIYACSGEGNLLEVNAATGRVTVGPMISVGCNNLAAPFGNVDCVL